MKSKKKIRKPRDLMDSGDCMAAITEDGIEVFSRWGSLRAFKRLRAWLGRAILFLEQEGEK